jgi:superfamily II DNA or RNA helicase
MMRSEFRANGATTTKTEEAEMADSGCEARSYLQFLETKRIHIEDAGISVNPKTLNKNLFPFQLDIVKWALRKGRAAIFCDCGLGKTIMQLEFAEKIPGKVLILAPLAVAQQTVREGEKFGIRAVYARKPIDEKITITNYEMLEHFRPADYNGIVLDESSILKSFDGAFRNEIIEAFRETPFRLACTATPAPNDYMELGNHSEFLGALTRTEMLSTFFVHDGGDTSKWRVKRHARSEFWRWVCTWAVMMRKPSDLGYSDEGFILPELRIHDLTVEQTKADDGRLFALPAITLQERRSARSATVEERAAKVAELADSTSTIATKAGASGDSCAEAAMSPSVSSMTIQACSTKPLPISEQWLVWTNLNSESEAATRLIPGAVEVRGSHSREEKEQRILDFATGKIRVLVSKPSIFGLGINLQNCHNVVFLGLSDSWETYYQAVRRCWRFGQKKPVHCYIVTSSQEGAVTENIKRKQADALAMAKEMVQNMHEINETGIKAEGKPKKKFVEEIKSGKGWQMYLGDCVDAVRRMDENQIHYSIFSPPFASLYTYSASMRDMGNCRTHTEFFEHFSFLAEELYRVTMPGRNLSFHCMNLPVSKQNLGYIGITDFRGDLIRIFQKAGFIFHSEVCIWKDPVTAMQRTKAIGLLHKQLKKDSCISRQGIPDYLVTMRKHGDNPERVSHAAGDFPVSQWQEWASPVWMDINPNDTLQRRSAREHEDERHICPLQLEVIRRAMILWSNPGDLVLSPFAGIGSEGYVAIQQGRRFIGIELKESYFQQAVLNLRAARANDLNLFTEASA